MKKHKYPIPTVDIIIEIKRRNGQEGIILIKRKNPPHGLGLGGGFVDVGDSLEEAAVREATDVTSLDIKLKNQFHTYSDPKRDPRKHTISTVYVAAAQGKPKAQDDAQDIGIFTKEEINFPLAFDHKKILADYFKQKNDYY